MRAEPNRRDFLGILVGAAGLWPSSTVFGQQRASTLRQPQSPITATRLSENLIELTGAGGNVVVVTGSDGLLMVNGGLRERSDDLLKAAAEHTGVHRVQTLFNTDWHPEHTGSNETLGKAGAKIVAHENTKQYLAAEFYVDWQNRT